MANDNDRVMIDSSVWISYFRRGKSAIEDDLNFLLDENRVAICGMIELEILQGLRGSEQETIKELFGALYFVETERQDFIAAGMMLSELRQKGIIIASSDCLIAVLCIRNNLPIFTLDKDFNYLSTLAQFKANKVFG